MNICIVDDDKYVVEKIVEGIDWKKCVSKAFIRLIISDRRRRF